MPKFLEADKYKNKIKPNDPEIANMMNREGIRAIGGLDAFIAFTKKVKLYNLPCAQKRIKDYEEYLERTEGIPPKDR